jgi:cysteine desulfurase
MRSIYLDSAASWPMYGQVISTMVSASKEFYGNPSATHAAGESAREQLEKARGILARELHVKPFELYLTSGVTESNNWVFQSASKLTSKRKKILISSIEHASVASPGQQLAKEGFIVETLKVDSNGAVDIKAAEKSIDKETLLVSVMQVNNLVGSVQPLSILANLCRKAGALFHTDAAQGFGKIPINLSNIPIDFLSASGHKVGGPRGIGLLFSRENSPLRPILYGGMQEKGQRAGTENVQGAIGFATALAFHKKEYASLPPVRKKLVSLLQDLGGEVFTSTNQAPHIIQASFPGVDAQNIVSFLSQRGVFVSAGSACESKKAGDTSVLRALGFNPKNAEGSIRFSINSKLSTKDFNYISRQLSQVLGLYI